MRRYASYRKISISCLSDAHVSGSNVIDRGHKSCKNNVMFIADLHIVYYNLTGAGLYDTYLHHSICVSMNKLRSFSWPE